ncbi:hypothetical protein Bhyg_06501, partial [Pseudolycoriella hygida]
MCKEHSKNQTDILLAAQALVTLSTAKSINEEINRTVAVEGLLMLAWPFHHEKKSEEVDKPKQAGKRKREEVDPK